MSSTLHFIDHLKVKLLRDPTATEATTVYTGSPSPETTEYPESQTEAEPINWIPYAIAAAIAISILILILCYCCRSIRDLCICCCLVKRGNRLMTPSKADMDPTFNSRLPETNRSVLNPSSVALSRKKSSSRSGSKSTTPKDDPPTTRSSVHSVLTTPSGSRSKYQSTNATPSRHQIASGVKTQKYIGTILSSGRRSIPPMSSTSKTQSAPTAANRVVRTQKLIGNILTQEKKR